MQQRQKPQSIWYFALGSSERISLCTQFCREHSLAYMCSPTPEALLSILSRPAIIDGDLSLFHESEKLNPRLWVIQVGQPSTPEQKKICEEYAKIGQLKLCISPTYPHFRKVLYPNLIFIYGPQVSENCQLADSLAAVTGYHSSSLLPTANHFITGVDKFTNLVVNNFFNSPSEARILAQYFNIKVVHLKYNRVDLPQHNDYFDKEFAMVKELRDKGYYIPCSAGSKDKILETVGEKLCPRLLYTIATNEEQRQYLDSYARDTGAMVLFIEQVTAICKRKGLPPLSSSTAHLACLSSIFYRDFERKEIVVCNFPNSLGDLLTLEKMNRKISVYVDLSNSDAYEYSDNYSVPIYFLEAQKWLRPNLKLSLKQQLKPKINYWLVGGPTSAGKTTVAKQLSMEFGFKLIEMETYLATVKEKLQGPEDGDEVPVKKVIEHFRDLLSADSRNTYVIDGLPYEKKDLEEWVRVVGVPRVLYLEVEELQQIKRTRKKAEGDLNAEVTEEETAKAKESTEKSRAWLAKITELQPLANIYKVDYNGPEIRAEEVIAKILKPRIFLVQNNNTNVYQNIALRYGLGFVNLSKQSLRDCDTVLKSLNKQNIIISNHGSEKGRNASEDVFWIEKNLGDVRYLGIWQHEEKEAQEEMMVLEKPTPPQKPKPVEGEPGEEKPMEDQPAEPPPPAEPAELAEENEGEGVKKKLDIYAYEWTKPGSYKNLTQWFFKSKHNVVEMRGTTQDCFLGFAEVLQTLGGDPAAHVYFLHEG